MPIPFKIRLSAFAIFLLISSPATGQGTVDSRDIVDGAVFREYRVGCPAGTATVNMILVDLDMVRDGSLAVEPALGGTLMGQCGTPAAIASRMGAVASVNGPYFASAGNRVYPLGFTMLSGRVAQLGDLTRPLVGLTSAGEFRVEVAHPKAFVTSDVYFEPVFLWGANQPAGSDHVTMYDHTWGGSVSSQGGTAVSVAPYERPSGGVIAVGPNGPERDDWDGVITDLKTSGSVEIPDDGFALVFRGQSLGAAERYQRGARVSLYAYELPRGWESMRWIATLGPWFVHDGNLRDYLDETSYGGGITGRANRTVIGTTWNNELFFAVTSGAGLSVREAAGVLIECNVREAVMCDSGSSSGMWASGVGSIGNSPAVPMAFVVRELETPPAQPVPIKVWQGDLHR
jgi:hypothetical protein